MFCFSVSEMSAKYKHTYMHLCFTGNYECLFIILFVDCFPNKTIHFKREKKRCSYGKIGREDHELITVLT